jgi:hypothetical protein
MTSLFVAALFYVLTPGIFLRLPPGGSKMVVAATHAVVFAVVFGLTQKAVWAYFKYEGFYGDDEEEEEGFFYAAMSPEMRAAKAKEDKEAKAAPNAQKNAAKMKEARAAAGAKAVQAAKGKKKEGFFFGW